MPLPIADRAPIQVSIPAVPNGENFRELDAASSALLQEAEVSVVATPRA